MEITLEVVAEGTLLCLVHVVPPPPAERSEHQEGWTHHAGRFAVRAEGGDPGPDARA